MAAIGIALYKYVMRYSPNNCEYFNRDRFVLSNGMSISTNSWRDALTKIKDMPVCGNIYSCTLSVSRA